MSLREDLLAFFEEHSEEYISGQTLAQSFGVSRNSVWKAVNKLKQDGYNISSVSNRGYKFYADNDVLSSDKIYGYMTEKAKQLKLVILKTTDSTNNEAKRMTAQGLTENSLIIANEQTAGRGRLGRSFYSPNDKGIYMSFVYHTELDITDAVSVTTAAAVAVVRAIVKNTDKRPQIKWVNDVYLDNRKICGILTEAVSDFESGTTHNIIIGIGINMMYSDFPDDIKDRAGVLNVKELSRNRLIAAVADEMMTLTDDLRNHSYIDDYRRYSMIIGKRIDFYKNNIKCTGTAKDIDENGGLIVMLDNGSIETLTSGEITIRLKAESEIAAQSSELNLE
ncbi:MAG: biotin--[Clostridia bacterium]|nr:biotin--[acetyl-CoA-carboxylase] ligase [Clostridia bacterium]